MTTVLDSMSENVIKKSFKKILKLKLKYLSKGKSKPLLYTKSWEGKGKLIEMREFELQKFISKPNI